MDLAGVRLTREAKFQGGSLETPKSIYSNRRKQHDEADSAIWPTLVLVLGLTLILVHDILTAYMSHWGEKG